MAELIDTGLVTAKTVRNRTLLDITDEGLETLRFFENRVSDAIKKDIDNYLSEKELELRDEVSIQGDYYKSVNGEYAAHLIAKEKGNNLMELTLSVPTEEIAASICDNWQKKIRKSTSTWQLPCFNFVQKSCTPIYVASSFFCLFYKLFRSPSMPCSL